MTGLNAINIYSNSLVTSFQENGESFPFSPKEATYFLGVFGLIGAVLAPIVMSLMNRKQNLLYG